MPHPIAGFPTRENVINIGRFALWTSSGRVLLDLGLTKWQISKSQWALVSFQWAVGTRSDLAKIQTAHIIRKFPKHLNTITFTVGRKVKQNLYITAQSLTMLKIAPFKTHRFFQWLENKYAPGPRRPWGSTVKLGHKILSCYFCPSLSIDRIKQGNRVLSPVPRLSRQSDRFKHLLGS